VVSAGYAELPIFEFGGSTNAVVVKGTPRTLLSGSSALSDIRLK